MFAKEIDQLLKALRKSPDYAGIVEQKDLVHQIAKKARKTINYTRLTNERLMWSGMLNERTAEDKVIIIVLSLFQALEDAKSKAEIDSLVAVVMPMLDDLLQEGYGERKRTN